MNKSKHSQRTQFEFHNTIRTCYPILFDKVVTHVRQIYSSSYVEVRHFKIFSSLHPNISDGDFSAISTAHFEENLCLHSVRTVGLAFISFPHQLSAAAGRRDGINGESPPSCTHRRH